MTNLRFQATKALAILLCLLAVAQTSSAYSVLTHEETVDLVWDDRMKPLLLKKFPKATPEDLKEAHAYAYGGCVMQDIGYYPFGNKDFSNLLHYVRSGDFVENMLEEAQDINEYAFALGALAHYASDRSGHPVINSVVPLEFPKLRHKYGNKVTYAEDPKAHIRTEFGFDVLQVAKQRYAPDTYHDFIGFKVSKPLLERTFQKTYGMPLSDLIKNEDLAIGSYRWGVSRVVPEMTRVALLIKHDQLVREVPNFNKKKFLYNLRRADYEKSWGSNYQRPGTGARVLAFLFHLIPKVGPFKALAFKVPDAKGEDMYFKSVNETVDRLRAYLDEIKQGKALNLDNRDLDTGEVTRAGEYGLGDDTYAKLLDKLAENNFAQVTPDLRDNMLAFYSNLNAPIATKRHPERWQKTLAQIEQLKSASMAGASGR